MGTTLTCPGCQNHHAPPLKIPILHFYTAVEGLVLHYNAQYVDRTRETYLILGEFDKLSVEYRSL